MNRQELIIAIAAVLFAAFLLGWLVRALIGRISRIGPQSLDELDRMARKLHDAEEARDKAALTLETREAELTERLARTTTELHSALDGLRESRAEIEELRDYIDRKLMRGHPDQG
ncbi:hypothetical protein [uncultured Paracoccus sp.]|uniref:hypothetical protein n=1 Tax=uncultured Paracoccus sp. TaxID=189685 RepID=UPI0025FED107|nr:hypothetical protein [uncultured Paracoccus sp.]